MKRYRMESKTKKY